MSTQTSSQNNPTRRHTLRMTVLATALMTLAGGLATASMAEPPIGAPAPNSQNAAPYAKNPERIKQMREHRIEFMHRELDTMSNRLQITASEQPVWDQYKKARMDLMPNHFERPNPGMNAAQIAEFRAERLEIMAKKMARLSKATSDLRAALSPDQQQVLDEMARQHRHKHVGARGQKPGMPQGPQGPEGIGRPMGEPM